MVDLVLSNPTAQIDLKFDDYLKVRHKQLGSHIYNGIPDYAFSLDAKIRQQLSSLMPIRALAKAIVASMVPMMKQIYQMEAVAVGPKQYPEIYATGEGCARTLGIGIPQIFIQYNPVMNGWTIATDDTTPIIILTSSLVESLSPEELRSVIGHECGHIHNLHGIYNTMWEMVTNPLAQGLLIGLQKAGAGLSLLGIVQKIANLSLWYLVSRWSRCAEYTCDRAGVICCGDAEPAMQAMGKLGTGGGAHLQGLNLEEYRKQLERVSESPMRLKEVSSSHPLGAKRVEAIRLFSECDVLYSWHPELKKSGLVRSKEDVDLACEKLVV